MNISEANTGNASANTGTSVEPGTSETRQDNALYQRGRRVAEVLDVRIDAQAREIHFGEIYGSDDLLIPEDCEFRAFRILIQKIGYASRQEAGAAHKGRVMKNVVADILGYRQQ
jgi:hypothetical protein